MKRATAKIAPEPTRRKFDGDWDQVLYCYYKILYWFYSRRNRSKAAMFCRSLEPVLKRVANKHEAIKGEECWSLLYEVRGDLEKAILYRTNEIRLIKKVQRIDPKMKDYGPADLADRWILLAMLYKDSNKIREAIRALKEAKRICTEKRVKFGSADLLGEYEAELHGSPLTSGSKSRPRQRSARQHPGLAPKRRRAWTGLNETI
jgi:tetratricopeptide (TPR) repeat protein